MADKTLQNKFVKSMKSIAKTLGKEPSDLNKAQFFKNDETGFSEWDVRKLGGFTDLKHLYFPCENAGLDIKHGSRMLKSHRNKLEKEYGQAAFYEKELLNAVTEYLKANPLKVHVAYKPKKKKAKTKRSIVAAISDTHFGSNISKEEMHGINEFNWQIASRRLALYMEQIVQYKDSRREDTDLVIQLNGDIIGGQIHNQEWFVDLLAVQFAGTLNILSQAITYAAQHFSKVKVVCTPGNHGRNVGKADKGRASTHKWDSYENMLYASLKAVLAQNHTNVEFLIPEAPFAMYKVQGHWIFQTHGDTVINVGNPGNSLNMASINNRINQINASELVKTSEKIAVVSVGHVHVPTVQLLNNGCILMINGCLSGVDPFAQSIGIFNNNPTQVIFESTEQYPVGDIRMIQVERADQEPRFDKIIKPFTGKMF